MTDARRAFGQAGEERAARWYRSHGYTIVDRNWRCREGELDLVVARGRTLVFVEVKTRRTDRFGTPAEAITWRKQQRLRTLNHQLSRYTQRHIPRCGGDLAQHHAPHRPIAKWAS